MMKNPEIPVLANQQAEFEAAQLNAENWHIFEGAAVLSEKITRFFSPGTDQESDEGDLEREAEGEKWTRGTLPGLDDPVNIANYNRVQVVNTSIEIFDFVLAKPVSPSASAMWNTATKDGILTTISGTNMHFHKLPSQESSREISFEVNVSSITTIPRWQIIKSMISQVFKPRTERPDTYERSFILTNTPDQYSDREPKFATSTTSMKVEYYNADTQKYETRDPTADERKWLIEDMRTLNTLLECTSNA